MDSSYDANINQWADTDTDVEADADAGSGKQLSWLGIYYPAPSTGSVHVECAMCNGRCTLT